MKPLRVLILQQRGWGLKFGHFIARRLQAQGCKLAAMTFKRSTHEFMTRQDEVDYEMIIGHDEIMDDPHHHLAGETFSLENIAEDLGLESVWPLIAALRNHVRSYGDKFFYSFRQNVSDEDIIAYVMAIHKCARRFLSEFQPDLIITSTFVSYAHAALGLYGERKGIPSIGTTDTKVRGISCFTNRYDETTGSFIERIDELNEGPDESPSLGRAREYIREARASLQRPAGDYASFGKPPAAASIADLIKNEIRPYYYILKWLTSAQRRSTNRHRALGITQDFRPPLCQLRDHYCFKKHKRFSDTYDYYPLDRISKAVYFPLQYQPESTIDMLAPFFTNQIEVARLAAMALPGDYTLMVKEHPSMVGLRPPSYLEKFARSPNVKIVDYRLSSETLLKKADAVITPDMDTYISGGNIFAGGGIIVRSLHNYDWGETKIEKGADAFAEASGGSLIGGGTGADATAEASADMDTYVGSGATLNAGYGIMITSLANNDAIAETDNFSAGSGVSVGASLADATASGTVKAHMDGAVNSGRNLSITALANNDADAYAEALGGGGAAAGTGANATSIASPTVKAYIGNSLTLRGASYVLTRYMTN